MTGQRRHEAPELGDAIVRMIRGLITRAAEGDQEAVEQLQRVAVMGDAGLQLGVKHAHDGPAAYSWTELGRTLHTSRQNAQQIAARAPHTAGAISPYHELQPGHDKRTCVACRKGPAA